MKKVFLLPLLAISFQAYSAPVTNSESNLSSADQFNMEVELETLSTRDSESSINGIENTLTVEASLDNVFFKPGIGFEVVAEFADQNSTELQYGLILLEQKLNFTKIETEYKIPVAESKRKKENSVLSVKAKNKFSLPNAYTVKTELKVKQTFKDADDSQKYYAKAELIKKFNETQNVYLVSEVQSDLDKHELLLTPGYLYKGLAKNLELEIFAEIPVARTGSSTTIGENIADNSTLGMTFTWEVL